MIYFVDPFFKFSNKIESLLRYFKSLIFNYSVINKIALNMYGSISLKTLLKSSAFYKCYNTLFSDEVLIKAKYVKQEIKNSEIVGDNNKFILAEELLQKYSAAKFVVTSRIHCALPCVGIGTPVFYVEDQQQAETSYCRLNGLIELFHVIKCDDRELKCEIVNEKITPDFSFTNKSNYKILAEKLIKTCKDFTGLAS